MLGIEDRAFGTCVQCKQMLLLNENNLCIHCELDALKKQILQDEVEKARYRRKIAELYSKLNRERAQQA